MKRIISFFVCSIFISGLSICFAQEVQKASKKVILFVSEQNIEGPQNSWWASEIDLSVAESVIAQNLIESGISIIDPAKASQFLKQDKAFKVLDLEQKDSLKLASLSGADYVVLGKALASAGGAVPDSKMISCFANITVKLIKVKDAQVLGYFDASGNSAHLDKITGGKEALKNAAANLSAKLVSVLNKDGGN